MDLKATLTGFRHSVIIPTHLASPVSREMPVEEVDLGRRTSRGFLCGP